MKPIKSIHDTVYFFNVLTASVLRNLNLGVSSDYERALLLSLGQLVIDAVHGGFEDADSETGRSEDDEGHSDDKVSDVLLVPSFARNLCRSELTFRTQH